MPEIPLINPESQGTYPQNMRYVTEWDNGKPAMVKTPGLSEYIDFATSTFPIRAMRIVGDYLYVLAGNTVYKVTSATTYSSIGTVSTNAGRAVMQDNGTYLMIAILGVNGYTYNISTDTFAIISDADFPVPGSLDYIDTYFIISSYDTQYFYISNSGDPTAWDATDYEDAERIADVLLGIKIINGEVWAGGSHSLEVYQNTGNAAFPFERLSGIYHGVGVASALCMVYEDNSLFFLDDKRMFRRTSGYTTKIISARGVAKDVQACSTISDCFGYSYVDKGDTFIVWTFPSENKTWVYCVNTDLWHRWAGYPSDGRHRSNCYAYFNGKHLVGSFEDDIVYELSDSNYHDAGHEIRSILVLPEIFDEGKDIEFSNFRLETHTGTGLVADLTAPATGEDPQVTLDYTNNRQRSWSNERMDALGKIGEYNERTIWDQLGTSDRRQFRVTFTEPCEWVISSAYFNVDY